MSFAFLVHRRFLFPVLLAALLLPSLTACGYRPTLGADPSAASPPSDLSSRNIRLEVFCRACTVAYSVGGRTGEDEGEGSWSRSFNVVPERGQGVSLSVNPHSAQDWIRRVRILVDGRIVAEADGMADGRNPREPVHLSASLF